MYGGAGCLDPVIVLPDTHSDTAPVVPGTVAASPAARPRLPGPLAGSLLALAVAAAVLGQLSTGWPAGIALVGAFLLAAAGGVVLFWTYTRRFYVEQERYRRQLFDAEMGALARLREAGQIREDVVASVSHEFRTPLTAIRGSAATLAARGEHLRADDWEALLAGIVEHADRLGRLLEDMLLAASATVGTDTAATADVSAALARFDLGQSRPPVESDVEPGLAAHVDALSLDQMVRALADHVRADARRDRRVTLRARREAAEVVLEVDYGSTRDEVELRELFEPFGSRESARTGHPASLALYVLRRLVEAAGGQASVRCVGGSTRLRVTLRGLRSIDLRTRPARPAAPAGAARVR